MTVTSILARQQPTQAGPSHPLVDAIIALAELHLDDGWAHEPKLNTIATGLLGDGHSDDLHYIVGELATEEGILAGTEPSHDPAQGAQAYRDSAIMSAQLLASTVLAERRAL